MRLQESVEAIIEWWVSADSSLVVPELHKEPGACAAFQVPSTNPKG